MSNAYLSWTEFKTQIPTNKGLLRYIDKDSFYHCWYNDLETTIIKDSGSDQTDFENNYKSHANKNDIVTDNDGAIIYRQKAAKAGWTYGLIPIELQTSKLDSLICKLVDGTNRPGVTLKFYDTNDSEVIDSQYENTIVKTILDFELPYDYEIIGGFIQQHTKPTTPVYLYVIAVPDIPAVNGGSKEMVGGVNLKYLDPSDKVETDGRVSKYMSYSATYHTNKLRVIIKHNAGIQHDLLICFELYRA